MQETNNTRKKFTASWDYAVKLTKINPISRVSPSTINIFSKCPFQGILSTNHTPELLPKSPSATVGIVIHKIMNIAARREISNFDDFKNLWGKYIHDEEESLLSNPLSKHQVPLYKSLRDLSTRKQKCWDSVRPLLNNIPNQNSSNNPDFYKDRFEIFVSTPENDVVGFIDEVIKTPDGIQLIDYKSGKTCDVDITGVKKIKPDYVLQLKIYAALYYLTYNIWPLSPLKIIEMGGQEFQVPYDQNEVLTLVQNAKLFIHEINSKIQKNEGNPRKMEHSLARPSPESCKYCAFRPACNSYWNKRRNDRRENWPLDICGTVTRVEKQGNDLFSIKISQNNPILGPVQIRGISPLLQYPLETGKEYAFYNLNKDRSTDHYRQGLLTTIYPFVFLNFENLSTSDEKKTL